MLKAIDRTMEIGGIRVAAKAGGVRATGRALIGFDEAVAAAAGRRAARHRNRSAAVPPAACWRSRSTRGRIDSPRSDLSAMDGYAVRDADLRPTGRWG